MIKKEKNIETEKEDIKKPKLLIASDTFCPRIDGISRFLKEILPYLENDFDITIIAPKYSDEDGDTFLHSKIYRFPVVEIKFGDFHFTNPDKKIIKQLVEECDAVFVQTLAFIGINTIKIANKLNKKIIAYSHIIEWEIASKSLKHGKLFAKVLATFIAKKYYNKCDLILIPNEEMLLKYSSKRITAKKSIVHVGIDEKVFSPPVDKAKAKELIGINPQNFVIGYHGRIAREKDLITLYRAFRHVEKKFSNVKLLIVGKGVEEEEKMFSSSKDIIFTGKKEDVVPYVQAMDIFVLTSLTETSSLSTIEAMSCAVPVIVTPVGYIKEIITEKENGMIFPFRNSMRLGKKIEFLINDSTLRNKIGSNGRTTVLKYFSWKRTSQEITSEIKGLL